MEDTGASQRNSKSSKKLMTSLTQELEHSQSQKLSKTKTIGRKKELVVAVRDANPAGTNAAPNIFWDVEGNLKTSVIDDGGVTINNC